MKRVVIAFSIYFFFNLASSQSSSLYMPPQFESAYLKGTRSWDGNPGPNYWQNRAHYKIKAEYDPVTKIISGSEEIVYINNSPDTILFLVTKLYQNAYKKGSARDRAIDPELVTDGVEILKFKVRGNTYYKDNQPVLNGRPPNFIQMYGTNLIIILIDDPIKPGEELSIEASWKLTLPKMSVIRTGYWDSTSFFAGYWYPQVAVYDDISGWDINSYTGVQETYSENATYIVEITLPGEYIVWATGEQQNEQEVFNKNILKRIKESKITDGYVRIIEAEDYDKGISKNDGMKTWEFKAENVPDFAWGASDHFIWDATSILVDKSDGRRVWISSVYPQNQNDYSSVIRYARESIDYLSNISPGVPFPYNKHITFHGLHEGGMELNNNFFSDSVERFNVTGHEIAHNYFPFYVLINEREYAWMDEGWVTVFGHQIILDKGYSRDQLFMEPTSNYSLTSRSLNNTPLMMPSSLLNFLVMNNHYYIKPVQANFLLLGIMKESGIDNPLPEYINRWAGKHPTPYDFFFTFNDILREDLSWFWKPWYFEFGYPDLGIKDVKQSNNQVEIIIEMTGNQPVPIHLVITYSENLTETEKESIRIWQDGRKEHIISINTDMKVLKVVLGNEEIPDVNPEDNIWERK